MTSQVFNGFFFFKKKKNNKSLDSFGRFSFKLRKGESKREMMKKHTKPMQSLNPNHHKEQPHHVNTDLIKTKALVIPCMFLTVLCFRIIQFP